MTFKHNAVFFLWFDTFDGARPSVLGVVGRDTGCGRPTSFSGAMHAVPRSRLL